MDDRWDAHARLRASSEALTDAEVDGLLPEDVRTGWGRSGAVEIGGQLAFVKRLPISDAEAADLRSTHNRFRVPTFYSYGVGSAGVGPSRELASHVLTTAWAADDPRVRVPLLAHARLVPAAAGVIRGHVTDGGDPDAAAYLAQWRGSRAIARMLAARTASAHDLVLVLEHVPHAARVWSAADTARMPAMVEALLETATALRQHGMVHFDAHLGNVVVADDGTPLLGDFGLTSAEAFDLTPTERTFLAHHTAYDHSLLLHDLLHPVWPQLRRIAADDAEERLRPLGFTISPTDWLATVESLLGALDRLVDAGLLDLDPAYLALVQRFGAAIVTTTGFLMALRDDPAKRAAFDDALARDQLLAAGVALP